MVWDLYYYPLCPLSQKIHWLLLQYNITFNKISIISRDEYIKIRSLLNFSPLPLLIVDKNQHVTESLLISEYIKHYCGKQDDFLIESRKIEMITDIHFYRDVYMNIVYERTLKSLVGSLQSPEVSKINEGLVHLKKYLIYFESIFQAYNWVNKFQFSLGDISLFTQLMCLDYCGQVPWLKIPETKKWYMRLKYRSEAQLLLSEKIGLFPPPSHYKLLDF